MFCIADTLSKYAVAIHLSIMYQVQPVRYLTQSSGKCLNMTEDDLAQQLHLGVRSSFGNFKSTFRTAMDTAPQTMLYAQNLTT